MIFNKRDFFKLNSYQKKYLSEIKKLSLTEPFSPWKNRVIVSMEGIFACGWTKSNLILMICYDGYILVNPTSGIILEKQYEVSPYDLMSKDNLEFKLLKNNELVKIFGLYGGNGNLVTSNGWKLEIISPSWPNEVILIRKPKISSENPKRWENIKLIKLEELEYTSLKCGFSYDEKHFLILGTNGVEIFSNGTD